MLLDIIIVLVASYFLKRYIDSKAEADTDKVQLYIDFKFDKIAEHPFVKNTLVPYLNSHNEYRKQVEGYTKELKKKYGNDHFQKYFWHLLLANKYSDSLKVANPDGNLSFTILNNGNSGNKIIWSGLYKGFISSRQPEFELTIFEKKEFGLDNVELKGRTILLEKSIDNKYHSILKIYLYLSDSSSQLEYGKKDEKYIGELAEFPLDFISPHRYTVWQKNKKYFDSLLSTFGLRLMKKEYEPDYSPDELGEGRAAFIERGFGMENDYVKFRIV